MKEALYYEKLDNSKVRCRLCPFLCLIAEGQRGLCGVRQNYSGALFSEIYGKTTGMALDPIEKKPLYHYHPGKQILSLGTRGCNLHCAFCQNWQISQSTSAKVFDVTPSRVITKAKELGSVGVAYTYNEPFIWYEFVLETAKLAREHGLKNVLVTNGYINPEPLEEIVPFIDAMNIDLKSIRLEFYEKFCGSKLAPVLETIERSARKCHIELTTLLIPALNDSPEELEELVTWVAGHLGSEVPLHFSRYFPCYKMNIPPTPIETLRMAERLAKKKLKYVYLGNI